MASFTIPVSELEGLTVEEIYQRFALLTEDQALNSEDGGDSDADDAIPVGAAFSPAPAAKRPKRENLPSTVTSPGTPTGTPDIDDELDGSPDNVHDTPDIVPRIIAEEGGTEDVTGEGQEDEETSSFEPIWIKGSDAQCKNIKSKFEKSNFKAYFGAKVDISTSIVSQIFFLFFNLQIAQLIVEQTTLYASQKGQVLNISVAELNAFIGISIIMGFNKLPSLRLYWSSNPNFTNDRISKIMTLKRFLFILRMLHLNDNTKMPERSSLNFDKLFKVRPILNHFNAVFRQVFSPSRFLSIDESMIAFKGRSSFKQYLPLKPIKRGFKIWVICCSVTGYMIGYDFYAGKTATREGPLGESVVLGLVRGYENLGYCIFFDRFFSSFSLVKKLLLKGCFNCSTILQTKKFFPKDLLKNDKNLTLGEYDYVSTRDMGLVKWKDRGTKSVCIVCKFNGRSI
ncbi:piggyBac transposable element-derived protein 4-like isoform X2 [Bacillus rossius redtenbacheri]|uniref:piggyBac transposable element-derived protein 4-like isoform X2 n=1 Tax=Bacillus rossius redtenbacheri TaxID=93214 RepID=UPI002FDE7C38